MKAMLLKLRKHKSIELKRIYVLKEYHSQKIGAKLMSFALDFAAEKNYELVWLGVWEHNEKAKSFYKKFGFVDTGYNIPSQSEIRHRLITGLLNLLTENKHS